MKSKRHFDGLRKTALMLTPLALAMSNALGEALPGGTLDPTTIPKYATPLVIPPVLYDDQGGTAPLNVEVALRQINQQMLPAPFPKTPLWAYGDPANPTTFNQPSFTIELTKDTTSRITWSNELVRNAKRCYADPNNVTNNINACKYRQHVLKDQNNRPLVDQTLHWAAPNQDCLDGIPRTDCRGASGRPYRGPVPMVTHVHGAHVGPESDGYPEAWWLPDAGNIPAGYATTGSFYNTTAAADAGSAVYSYTNDQPSATLWYHDHSLGMTRLNVYAAGAGFWLIREADDGETGLVRGTLPGPAPRLGEDPNGDTATRAAIREIPIAIQGKSFNADGTLFYPANRAFFEELDDGQVYAANDPTTPNPPGTPVAIPFLPEPTSDISPVWNPEAFFNTILANGNPWPQLAVAPERYRFRLLNATNSRFLNLAMFVVDRTTGQIDSTPGDCLLPDRRRAEPAAEGDQDLDRL